MSRITAGLVSRRKVHVYLEDALLKVVKVKELPEGLDQWIHLIEKALRRSISVVAHAIGYHGVVVYVHRSCLLSLGGEISHTAALAVCEISPGGYKGDASAGSAADACLPRH